MTWLAVALFMAAFVVLLGGLTLVDRLYAPHPEITRKLLHTGSGLLTLSFPFLFDELWPVLLLTVGSALILGAVKFIAPIRQRLGRVVDGVGRTTLGELYFPVSVAVVFWLSLHRSPLLFVIPILVLTLADTLCALVGAKYGRRRFTGASKTLEGSIVFVFVAFFCIQVPLLLWSDVGRVETLLISMTLALVAMLLEGSGWRGLDNLFIPIGGFFLLRAYLPMTAEQLLARLVVSAGLVAIVMITRRRSTLVDDSLLAGAFLCYLTWALGGTRWLAPPAIVFVGHRWFSPRTEENSRRMHTTVTVLAVWAGALVWLALASTLNRPELLYPFTLVFACHLAIFGLSRTAHGYPEQPLSRLIALAIVKSWVLVFVPFLLIEGGSLMNLRLALLAGVAIAAATLGFASTEPSIRDMPRDLWRWVRQGTSAAAGSAIGWLVMTALNRAA